MTIKTLTRRAQLVCAAVPLKSKLPPLVSRLARRESCLARTTEAYILEYISSNWLARKRFISRDGFAAMPYYVRANELKRNLFCKIGTIARIEEADPLWKALGKVSIFLRLLRVIPRCIEMEFEFRASASPLNWNSLFSFQMN